MQPLPHGEATWPPRVSEAVHPVFERPSPFGSRRSQVHRAPASSPRAPAPRPRPHADFENPLFGTATLASPSPAAAGAYNPVWSPAPSSLAHGGFRAPPSAPGLLRLGTAPLSSLLPASQQQQPGGNVGGAWPQPAGAPGLPPPPPAATATLLRGASPGQQAPILPTSPAGGTAGGLAGLLGGSGAAAAAALVPGRDRPEEYAFAETLGAVMRGEADAAEALTQYAAICRQQAANLRCGRGLIA